MKKIKASKRNILLNIALIIAILLPLIVFIYLVFVRPNTETPVYNNIPIDSRASKVEEGKSSSVNKASFEFSKDIIFNNKVGKINFKNPASATQTMTLELFISDAELKSKIGKTGRKIAEQNNLEQENYDPTRAKVRVGKSGSVPPGYNLSSIELSALPDGSELPSGSYDGTINLTMYTAKTNEKAMVNSQLNVTIIVK